MNDRSVLHPYNVLLLICVISCRCAYNVSLILFQQTSSVIISVYESVLDSHVYSLPL
jgi:hypothetical protein